MPLLCPLPYLTAAICALSVPSEQTVRVGCFHPLHLGGCSTSGRGYARWHSSCRANLCTQPGQWAMRSDQPPHLGFLRTCL